MNKPRNDLAPASAREQEWADTGSSAGYLLLDEMPVALAGTWIIKLPAPSWFNTVPTEARMCVFVALAAAAVSAAAAEPTLELADAAAADIIIGPYSRVLPAKDFLQPIALAAFRREVAERIEAKNNSVPTTARVNAAAAAIIASKTGKGWERYCAITAQILATRQIIAAPRNRKANSVSDLGFD